MNIKQKMIEAMDGSLIYTTDKDDGKCGWEIALDAALAVLADPSNFTIGMKTSSITALMSGGEWVGDVDAAQFAAVINHVREQKG